MDQVTKYNVRENNINFVFILPNVAIYLKYFFDFISEKKVHIHASFSDQVKITMVVCCYFPPQTIIDYIEAQLPKEIIAMHGTMRFKPRVKRVKRAYAKRKSKAITEPKNPTE